MNLDGSSAIVTGGAGGLGGAPVRRLAGSGADVVIRLDGAQRFGPK